MSMDGVSDVKIETGIMKGTRSPISPAHAPVPASNGQENTMARDPLSIPRWSYGADWSAIRDNVVDNPQLRALFVLREALLNNGVYVIRDYDSEQVIETINILIAHGYCVGQANKKHIFIKFQPTIDDREAHGYP